MSDFNPYDHLHVKLNPDGSLTRFLNFPGADANPEPNSESVVSKDVILDPEKNTSARIYLPTAKLTTKDDDTTTASGSASTASSRLPIIVFFHSSSFILVHPYHISLHMNLCYTTCSIHAIVILVDYRLAPESRLPAAYDDAIDALLWLKEQALNPKGEKWLRDFGDFSRCYLHGSGSGGNIAFHAALRASEMDWNPLRIDGIILNQPLFGGKQRTKSEIRLARDQLLPLPALDVIWDLSLPQGADRDHWYCNPMVDGPHKSKLRSLQRCLILGFGMDPLVDRQQEIVKLLVASGVRVEAHFDEIGFHGIEFVDSRRYMALDSKIKDFIDLK